MGEHCEEFRLGPGFEAEVVRLAEVENFLDDVPLLIHLDRVNAAVAPLVVELLDGVRERLVDLADAMAEDVGEAEQDRELDAAFLELIDEFLEVDRLLGLLVRMDDDVALVVDGEVALAPVADAVGFVGVLDLPLRHHADGARVERRPGERPGRGGEIGASFVAVVGKSSGVFHVASHPKADGVRHRDISISAWLGEQTAIGAARDEIPVRGAEAQG